MTDGRATIKDVALEAGVSISTVSRTLSGKMFVEEATRRKVLSAVEKLHYEPNMIAKGLKEKKTLMIAVLVPDMNSLYYSALMGSIEKYANQAGYSVVLSNSQNDYEKEARDLEMFRKRYVDGILCLCINDDISHIQDFVKESSTPLIFINRDLSDFIGSVSVDGRYGGYMMTKYLLDHGCQKVAGIFEESDRQRYRDRYQGYLDALKEYGAEVYEEYAVWNAADMKSAYEKTKKLFSKKDHPDAMFISSEAMVLGVYRALHECGLSVPEDVSLTGFDNVITNEYVIPPLTTYDSEIDELARNAVANLLEQINGAKHVKKMKLRGDVVERASVRKN